MPVWPSAGLWGCFVMYCANKEVSAWVSWFCLDRLGLGEDSWVAAGSGATAALMEGRCSGTRTWPRLRFNGRRRRCRRPFVVYWSVSSLSFCTPRYIPSPLSLSHTMPAVAGARSQGPMDGRLYGLFYFFEFVFENHQIILQWRSLVLTLKNPVFTSCPKRKTHFSITKVKIQKCKNLLNTKNANFEIFLLQLIEKKKLNLFAW